MLIHPSVSSSKIREDPGYWNRLLSSWCYSTSPEQHPGHEIEQSLRSLTLLTYSRDGCNVISRWKCNIKRHDAWEEGWKGRRHYLPFCGLSWTGYERARHTTTTATTVFDTGPTETKGAAVCDELWRAPSEEEKDWGSVPHMYVPTRKLSSVRVGTERT